MKTGKEKLKRKKTKSWNKKEKNKENYRLEEQK